MQSNKSVQETFREEAVRKIRKSVLEILMNPKLRGRVQLITSDPQDSHEKILEVNFAILFEQRNNKTIKIRKGTVSIRFDPMFPQEGPSCILVETGSGSTYRSQQFWPTLEEGEETDVEKMLINILIELQEPSICEKKSEEEGKKVNLQVAGVENKNQSFLVSNNSCFSRIQNPSFLQTCNLINFNKIDDHRDSNSDYFKGKRNSKPMKKNANLPKFLIRIFIKYLDKFKKIYPRKEYERLYNDCKKMKEWKRTENKQHALGLKHLKQLFQDQKAGYPDPDLNRKVVIKIISEYLLEEICQNSQIPETHRLGYLVACRVYALRCRNSALAGRIQSK